MRTSEHERRRVAEDLLIAELAAASSGIVDRAELDALGISPDEIAYRLQIGRLHRLHRGVYAVGHRSVDRRGRWIAALRACGPQSALCGWSGAAISGLSVIEDARVEVCVPHTGRLDCPGIRLHRAALRSADRAIRDGLPVMAMPRLLLHLASRVGERRLEKLVAEASHRGLLEARATVDLLRRARGHRGIRALRLACEGYLGQSPTRSPPEAAFIALCRRHRLPEPLVNVPVLEFEVDFLWPRARLVVEVDGFSSHRHRHQFERDRLRAVTLRGAGYEYLAFTPRQLGERSEWVVESVRAALHEVEVEVEETGDSCPFPPPRRERRRGRRGPLGRRGRRGRLGRGGGAWVSRGGRRPRRRPRRGGRRSCRTPRSPPRACRIDPSRSASRRPRG